MKFTTRSTFSQIFSDNFVVRPTSRITLCFLTQKNFLRFFKGMCKVGLHFILANVEIFRENEERGFGRSGKLNFLANMQTRWTNFRAIVRIYLKPSESLANTIHFPRAVCIEMPSNSSCTRQSPPRGWFKGLCALSQQFSLWAQLLTKTELDFANHPLGTETTWRRINMGFLRGGRVDGFIHLLIWTGPCCLTHKGRNIRMNP